MAQTTDAAPDTGNGAFGEGGSEFETLQDILFSGDRRRIGELEARVNDPDALAAMVSPILGDAIRRKIHEDRDEMIEALYPIIGGLVVRAVGEAIRDLARSVDGQMRTSFTPSAVWHRFQGRLRGVSSGEMLLRQALPFAVDEVFLIHRETGLLLSHVSRHPDKASDSDVISGMLTAIRDFVQDTFGQGREGDIDQILYGDQCILIESSRLAYIAAVTTGVEPTGFRNQLRETLFGIDFAYGEALRRYSGDTSVLAGVDARLAPLLVVGAADVPAPPPALSRTQKRILLAAAGILTVCIGLTCLGSVWVVRTVQAALAPPPVATATPTPTPTATLTPTPPPTATATTTLTATATSQPSPTLTPTPAPVLAVMTGSSWLRSGPSLADERLNVAVTRGQAVELLAQAGDWYEIRWTPPGGSETVGWVQAEWVGTTGPIPSALVTPTAEQ